MIISNTTKNDKKTYTQREAAEKFAEMGLFAKENNESDFKFNTSDLKIQNQPSTSLIAAGINDYINDDTQDITDIADNQGIDDHINEYMNTEYNENYYTPSTPSFEDKVWNAYQKGVNALALVEPYIPETGLAPFSAANSILKSTIKNTNKRINGYQAVEHKDIGLNPNYLNPYMKSK